MFVCSVFAKIDRLCKLIFLVCSNRNGKSIQYFNSKIRIICSVFMCNNLYLRTKGEFQLSSEIPFAKCCLQNIRIFHQFAEPGYYPQGYYNGQPYDKIETALSKLEHGK